MALGRAAPGVSCRSCRWESGVTSGAPCFLQAPFNQMEKPFHPNIPASCVGSFEAEWE